MIKPVIYNSETRDGILNRAILDTTAAEEAVKKIIDDVRRRGDEALREYTAKFDGAEIDELAVTDEEFARAERAVGSDYVDMLRRSAENISSFHRRQLRPGFEIKRDGCVLGQKVTPLSAAGIYVPGGKAAYPSTVLMNAIPARIAGVGTIVMVTPPLKDGSVKPEVLVAAKVAGISKVYKVGGAQAIAALAYGTQSIARVDKITGPGNIFVATAKKLVYGVCGIDMIAGPSEILPRNGDSFFILFYRRNGTSFRSISAHQNSRKTHCSSHFQNPPGLLRCQKESQKVLGFPANNRHVRFYGLSLDLVQNPPVSRIQRIDKRCYSLIYNHVPSSASPAITSSICLGDMEVFST